MAGPVARVWNVPIANPRSLDPAAAAEIARRFRLDATPCATLAEGLEAARAWARAENTTLLVCGSLFLVGEVLGRGHAH